MNFLEKLRLFPTHYRGFLMSDPERNGEYKFLRNNISGLSDNSTVFDVGANIGDYTQKLLEINPKLMIYCFEPVPKTFGVLSKIFSNTPNVKLNQIALSDKSGKNEIYEYGELKGINSIEFHPKFMKDDSSRIEINTSTISGYCLENNIHTINFLKIDVEGHELNVIRGAIEMLAEKRIEIIQWEYNILWKNSQNRLEDVFNLLIENYDIYRLTFWGKIRVKKFTPSLENFPLASNYVALLKD